MKINTEIKTKEQAETLIEKLKNFNEPLQFGRWITSDGYPIWLAMYDNINNLFYGLNAYGEWFCEGLYYKYPNFLSINRYATEKEILDGLSKMALKMGYKKGVRVDISSIVKDCIFTDELISYNHFKFIDNILYLDNNCIMKDGKWATIIKQEPTTIESLEKRIEALESKLK